MQLLNKALLSATQGGCAYPPIIDTSGAPGTVFGPTIYDPTPPVDILSNDI